MAVSSLIERTSFTAGELTPTLYAREDLAKHQTGLDRCENMMVMVEGGVTRRPGTAFVIPLKSEAEQGLLMPFEFSRADNYMLVFNAGVMRVMRNGGVVEAVPGTPYEMVSPWVAADLPNLRWAQAGNAIFVASGKQPKVIQRAGHTSWSVIDYAALNGPVKEQNFDKTKTIWASAQTGSVTLTASAPIFQAGHVGSTWRLDEKDLSQIPAWKGNETGLTPGALRRNRGNIYSVVSGADAGPNAPTQTEGDYNSGVGNILWRFDTAAQGYVKITGYTSPTQVTATVIDKLPLACVGAGNATYRWYEGEWSDVLGWPTQVLLYDNRLIWARGNKFWMTSLGDLYDFAVTDQEDSAIALGLTSSDGRLVDVSWMLNSGVVVVGTDSSEWTVRAKDTFGTITFSTVRAVPNASEGSAPHRPLAIDGGVVFIGRSRDRLHFGKFDAVAEAVTIDELTLFGRRILKGRAAGLAYQRDPNRIVWVRLLDGTLAAVTFRPEQQVIGWSRHPMTNGFVEDIAVLPSADAERSELWMIVRRTINGQTRRYVEVMKPFFEAANPDEPDALGAWFVDCGATYSGAPATVISGLGHLIGETVNLIADGVEHRELVVSPAGSVTLDRAASNVTVGLPITWKARLLNLNASLRSGPTRGTAKQVKQVVVERFESAGGFVQINDGPPEALLKSGTRTLATPQPLVTGLSIVFTQAAPADVFNVQISGSGVYPFTLLGLSPRVTFSEAGG